MSATIESHSQVVVSLEGTRDYYLDVTRQYGRYGGAARGWHYGVWDEGVTSHQQSLLRSNELLVEGLALNPNQSLLDVGCGNGGFAVWAAKTFGCRAHGITLVQQHTEIAMQHAKAEGVAHLCSFEVAEMDTLPFDTASFDAVTNQDSFCHAVDKGKYLSEVKRVLRSGGAWRAVDFSIQPEPLSDEQKQDYVAVLEGFQIPSLISPQATEETLRSLGFGDVACHDITDRVLPSARYIQRMCRLPKIAMDLHLDWTFFGLNAGVRKNRQGHVLAARAYNAGLFSKYFRHGYYLARG